MYTAPFHRRILPWMFATVFVIAAPAAVFYTSGYRWNPKKNKIERNGTLILDSLPKDATIYLNDERREETTPITLQDLPPGNYTIRLEKTDYHSWQKELTVEPEYVTFANSIHLWKTASPVLLYEEKTFTHITTSPDGKHIALFARPETGDTNIEIRESAASPLSSFSLPADLSDVSLVWSEDSRSLLIQETSSSSRRTWVLSLRNTSGPLLLPSGSYRWNQSRLEGSTERQSIVLGSDGSIVQTPLGTDIIDRFEEYSLRSVPAQKNEVLFAKNNPLQEFVLPPGDWRIHGFLQNRLLLRSTNTSNWIVINLDESPPVFQRAQGDRLRTVDGKDASSFLLLNGGEIWHWNGLQEPELLARESQPFKQVLWHPDGGTIFVATNRQVYALELDVRNGRLRTPLADFDEIYDMALTKKKLVISGLKNGKTGLWLLEVE